MGKENENLKYVGKSFIREDVYDKVRGRTQYTCDRKIEGMLYAKLVLSEKANAQVEIHTEKAKKVPGIHAVFTYANIPKIKYNPHKWSASIAATEDQYILSDKARYYGDHLALVVGETKAAVEEAVSLVEIEYSEEEPVLGLKAAREREDTLAFDKTVTCGDYEKLEKSDLIKVRTIGTSQKIHHSAIEPHTAVSQIDELGNLVLWTPCQTVYQVRYHISHLLGIPYSKVRVIKAVMGGSFGGKGQTVVEPACAFATWILKRPVLLYMDRPDAVTGTRSRNACETTVETAVTKDGMIIGRTIETDFDGGAYYTNASSVAMAYCKKLFRMYRIENQTCHVRTFFTNTIAGGACRGYGSPQAHAITEVNLDEVANAIGMDPCEFRLKNVVHPMDEDPTGGTNIGNAQIAKCIQQGSEAFEWKEKRAHIHEKDTMRYAYGVGMACGAHGNGYKGAYPELTNVHMMLNPDDSVEVKIGIHDQGCGTVMTMQQVAAEALCMDVYKIKVYEADTFITPYDSAGTQASRVTYVCGRAVQEAGVRMLDKIKEACEVLFGWKKDEILAEDGFVQCQGKKKSYGQVALEYETQKSKNIHVELEYQPPTNPGSYCCAFVEVRVDKYTGQTKVIDLLCVHDVGQTMNLMLAQGQVEGGAQMSLGQALFEEIIYDAQGRVKNKNFSKYHVINAPDMPKVRSIFIEDGEPNGPYGGKSLGEIAAVAPAPAVANAINFAIGSHFSSYPITPEKVVTYLEAQRKEDK